MFSATLDNICVISWPSDLRVEDAGTLRKTNDFATIRHNFGNNFLAIFVRILKSFLIQLHPDVVCCKMTFSFFQDMTDNEFIEHIPVVVIYYDNYRKARIQSFYQSDLFYSDL